MSGFWDFLSDPRLLDTAATVVRTAGQLMTADSQLQYGEESLQAAEFQADQLRDQAGGAVASAQRAAWIEDRNARIVASNALAAAAASGGGASDPTVVNIIAGIAQEGAYRQSVALYQGEDKARQLRLQAQARLYEGESRKRASSMMAGTSMLGATTSLLRGAVKDSSMLQRFGGDGPQMGASINSDWSN